MKFYKALFWFGALVVAISCNKDEKREYNLIITDALIVDGTGEDSYYGDVLVQNDLIVGVEKDTTVIYKGGKVLNAKGLCLTPGFIDTHSHGDPLKTPEFHNFLAMGVTTICLGQDGFSPRDVQSWITAVDSIKPAVNIALFAGHNTLRMLSGITYDRSPDPKQLSAMLTMLAQAMDAGCWGLTTGLEYTPGYYAGKEELIKLAKIVGEKGGIIMSHIRNEDNNFVVQSLQELLQQGNYCPVHVSHVKVVYGKGEQKAHEIIHLLDSAREAGIQATADIYPYTASYTGIGILFPDWAKKPNDYSKVLENRRKELARFLKRKIEERNGAEATLIGSGSFKGSTLAAVAATLNKPPEEVLMEDIGPYGASGAYFIMNKALQDSLLMAPFVNVCTDGSPEIRHPRGYGAFARIINEYVIKKRKLTIEEAIFKMTGLPAQTLGFSDRGLIRKGYKADILLFDPEKIEETATYENPHRLAKGMQHVIINGQIVKHGTEFVEGRHGQVLKH